MNKKVLFLFATTLCTANLVHGMKSLGDTLPLTIVERCFEDGANLSRALQNSANPDQDSIKFLELTLNKAAFDHKKICSRLFTADAMASLDKEFSAQAGPRYDFLNRVLDALEGALISKDIKPAEKNVIDSFMPILFSLNPNLTPKLILAGKFYTLQDISTKKLKLAFNITGQYSIKNYHNTLHAVFTMRAIIFHCLGHKQVARDVLDKAREICPADSVFLRWLPEAREI